MNSFELSLITAILVEYRATYNLYILVTMRTMVSHSQCFASVLINSESMAQGSLILAFIKSSSKRINNRSNSS